MPAEIGTSKAPGCMGRLEYIYDYMGSICKTVEEVLMRVSGNLPASTVQAVKEKAPSSQPCLIDHIDAINDRAVRINDLVNCILRDL